MPFTPFHFGPAACVSLPLRQNIDTPVFILVSLAVDIEPLAVMLFGLRYPLHGYAHTLLGSAIVGLVFGALGYRFSAQLERGMSRLRLEYRRGLGKSLLSGVAGAWMHVIMDAFLYNDLQLMYPYPGNQLLGMISMPTMYLACGIAFLPALALYFACRGTATKYPIS